jgi:hypothetical protein
MDVSLTPRSVALAAGALIVLALTLLPVADRPMPALPGIVGLSAVGFLVTELSTSFLLLVRFRAVRTWSLLLLACAYFYSGLMPIPHLLTFPGAVLAERPLVGTSSQSTSWIFALWIDGFALLSLISVVLEARRGQRRIAAENVGRAAAVGFSLAAVAAVMVVLVAIGGDDYLPPQVSGASFTRLSLATSFLAYVLLAASIGIVLLAIKARNRLFLWLALALTAMLFGNVLVTGGGGRFTVGWTIGRLSWVVSASVLFIYLMRLHAHDQQLWAHARELLSGSAEGEAAEILGGDSGQAVAVVLERFVARENIARYRRLLEEPQEGVRRQVLMRLLAEEELRLASTRPITEKS